MIGHGTEIAAQEFSSVLAVLAEVSVFILRVSTIFFFFFFFFFVVFGIAVPYTALLTLRGRGEGR